MANTDYKSPDALMRHLRDNGISISGSSQKQQLINTGYFHGYKGYRFFVSSSNRLPFTSYNEINATIQYDTKLKSLLYGKMMFIEIPEQQTKSSRLHTKCHCCCIPKRESENHSFLQ